ncbi:MAG: nuclear transport factor 2 family protein [Limnohabitans sp.]|jgi:ketosteroid isomerase-like protein|uniref:nuclear transport factor 2 family protein n=1 Tax=Limnohabitans sp. TaxID=1907725 RepID=UPI0011D9255E|nr:MAG: nuclear transport factor 2 family protein [Limnohabitans sp.]
MTHTPPAMSAAVQQLVQFFEKLQPQDLPRLSELYAADARFKDPFNEVQGLSAIERIFAHMFESLDSPHFVVTERIMQGTQCFLVWDFRFRFKRFDTTRWQTVRGGTHLVFNDAGLVTLHRDYWDAAEELYEKLPMVGGLMRWLKRRANS